MTWGSPIYGNPRVNFGNFRGMWDVEVWIWGWKMWIEEEFEAARRVEIRFKMRCHVREDDGLNGIHIETALVDWRVEWCDGGSGLKQMAGQKGPRPRW